MGDARRDRLGEPKHANNNNKPHKNHKRTLTRKRTHGIECTAKPEDQP